MFLYLHGDVGDLQGHGQEMLLGGGALVASCAQGDLREPVKL